MKSYLSQARDICRPQLQVTCISHREEFICAGQSQAICANHSLELSVPASLKERVARCVLVVCQGSHLISSCIFSQVIVVIVLLGQDELVPVARVLEVLLGRRH